MITIAQNNTDTFILLLLKRLGWYSHALGLICPSVNPIRSSDCTALNTIWDRPLPPHLPLCYFKSLLGVESLSQLFVFWLLRLVATLLNRTYLVALRWLQSMYTRRAKYGCTCQSLDVIWEFLCTIAGQCRSDMKRYDAVQVVADSLLCKRETPSSTIVTNFITLLL